MIVNHCDVCKSLIKNKKIKYILLLQKIQQIDISFARSLEEIPIKENKDYEPQSTKEICVGCKKVYDYLFALRKEELEKIKNKLKVLETDSLKFPPPLDKTDRKLLTNSTEYCKCDRRLNLTSFSLSDAGQEICLDCNNPINPEEKRT